MVKIFFLSAIEFKMWIIIACFMLLPILNQQLIRFGLKMMILSILKRENQDVLLKNGPSSRTSILYLFHNSLHK